MEGTSSQHEIYRPGQGKRKNCPVNQSALPGTWLAAAGRGGGSYIRLLLSSSSRVGNACRWGGCRDGWGYVTVRCAVMLGTPRWIERGERGQRTRAKQEPRILNTCCSWILPAGTVGMPSGYGWGMAVWVYLSMKGLIEPCHLRGGGGKAAPLIPVSDCHWFNRASSHPNGFHSLGSWAPLLLLPS